MKHYYENVPGLGNVAVSRHAQGRMEAEGISEELFERTLSEGKRIEEGFNTVHVRGGGIVIVILMRPEPFAGARLVKTVFKPGAVKDARRI